MAPPPAVPQEAACSAEPSSWQRLACACHPQLQPGRARRHGLPGQHLYTLYVHAPPWPDFKGARRATARHLPFASCCERDVELRAAACPHTPTLAASPRAVTSSRVWWAHHGCLPPQYPPPPARPPPPPPPPHHPPPPPTHTHTPTHHHHHPPPQASPAATCSRGTSSPAASTPRGGDISLVDAARSLLAEALAEPRNQRCAPFGLLPPLLPMLPPMLPRLPSLSPAPSPPGPDLF